MEYKYGEGPKAKAKFEQAMKRLFRAPKSVKQEKQQDKPAASEKKREEIRQGLERDRLPRPCLRVVWRCALGRKIGIR
jgi:hypothetical protein